MILVPSCRLTPLLCLCVPAFPLAGSGPVSVLRCHIVTAPLRLRLWSRTDVAAAEWRLAQLPVCFVA